MPERSGVYDMHGDFYSRLSGENRIVIPFDRVSNDFINALLAREDSRFYSHRGVDPVGIARAIGRNLLFGGIREGASTITQQLARNSFPLGGRNLHRKLIEAALAFRIETELTKEQILEAYLNRIYFGSGCYGLESAARLYFGKPASQLDLSESALLAGLIRSPNRYSPRNNLEASIRQRNAVLRRMEAVGYITLERRLKAEAEPVTIAKSDSPTPQEDWAMDAILRELELVTTREQMEEGGLRIYTSIDPTLQRAAEASVRRRLAEIEARAGYVHAKGADGGTDVLQGAVVAIDNRTGGIRAIVGGRDYRQSKFHRALFASRQIGSAVKPFVYAVAFENGLRPEAPVSDARLGSGDIPGKYGVYEPANSDGTYGGNLPAAEGLIRSRNTMAVRVGMQTGIDKIADRLIRLGLADAVPRFPSLFLGAFESTLKELTAAYTVFATGGVKLQPVLVERITDSSGDVIFKATHGRIPMLTPSAAAATALVLEDVVTRGTAASASALGLRHRAAGKTGTTDRYCDAWFVGFDKQLTCGVWVGFDQPKMILRGAYASETALPIWVDVLEANKASSSSKKH